MKLVVFSDSHRSLRGMRDAVELEQPDYVLHLGDLEEDARLLAQEYPRLAVASVPGNCDFNFTAPLLKKLTYDGVTLLLSHGHIWQVKSGYGTAIQAARTHGAHILLFGHTHTPVCQQLEDGLWVVNPGSIRDHGDYTVILLKDGSIDIQLKRI